MNFNILPGTVHQVQGGALYGPLFTVSGNNAAWTKRIIPLGMFSNLETKNTASPRIVFKYTSGSSFRADVQLDDFKIGNCYYWDANAHKYGTMTWNFDSTNQITSNYFLTTTTNTSSYFSASWTGVTTSTTSARWNRDCSGTPSSSTGLSSGNTGSCYLYVETSSFFNSTAWLDTILWSSTTGYAYQGINKVILTPNSYFEFYEARYGSNMGTLEMYVYVPDEDYF